MVSFYLFTTLQPIKHVVVISLITWSASGLNTMTQIIFIIPIVEHRLYEYHELQRNLLHEVSQTEDFINQKYSVDIVLYSNFDIFCTFSAQSV